MYPASALEIPVVEACSFDAIVYYILEILGGTGRGAHQRPGAVLRIDAVRTLDVSLCVYSRRAC